MKCKSHDKMFGYTVNSNKGTLTYSYLALEGSHPLRCYSLTESPTTMVVYGAATFNYAGASNCVVNILIEVKCRSGIEPVILGSVSKDF